MRTHALIVLDADSGARRTTVALEEGVPVTIGRAPSNDVVLADARVSGHHARVWIDADGLWVRDLGSRNGTWLIRHDGAERVASEQDVPVGEDLMLRVAVFDLVPCALLGEDVTLRSNPGLGRTIDETPVPTDPPTADPTLPPLAPLALAEALRGTDLDGTWVAVLDGLLRLTDAQRGFLLSSGDGRFLVRASRGGGSISQRFLQRTLESGTWCVRLGDGPPEGLTTSSVSDLEPGTLLYGVRFAGRAGRPVAVGCVEQPGAAAAVPTPHLAMYAELAGPLLESALALDREARGREAAEARVRRERGGSDPAPSDGAPTERLVGRSAAFRAAVDAVRRAAPAATTILIRGPSGTGKEELAHLAHEASPRRDHPMLAVNCAAIPETLVESELFGHEKGAFTGAEQRREGAFALADGGTLFLDEIGDLPLAAQAKILRVIETGEVVRVGGGRRRVDVRLVAATHRALETMVREREFREDLYYRLRVIEVVLPSLAERTEDIPLLAEHFLKRLRRPDGRRLDGISARAAQLLTRYPWPGNIREMRNVIERAVVLDRDGVLDVDDLPAELVALGGPRPTAEGTSCTALLDLPWNDAREAFDELYFRTAWTRSGKDVQTAADATGVERRTLYNKINRYDLPRKDA